MARKRNNDFVSFLRSQGLRKSVAKALSDLESGSRGASTNAQAVAQRVINDLRSAADAIEKRLDIGGAGTRSRAAKRAAKTRKRSATKRSATAKRAAAKRTRKATSGARKAATSGARKATSSARKTTRKSTRGRKRAS